MCRLPRVLLVALFAASACTDRPLTTAPPPDPDPAPLPIGVYEFTVTGLTGESPSASVALVGPGMEGSPELDVRASLDVAPSPLPMEEVNVSAVTEGARPRGQRYVSVTYQLRNATGVPLNNVTFIPVTNASTKAQTPFLQMRKFDGTQVDTMVMRRTVPSGVVAIGQNRELLSPVQDVLQVFEESEVAAIPLPVGLTGIFPYGFVVRSRLSSSNRTLPATSDVHQFDGLLTFSFRIPLQPNDPGTTNGATKDAFSFTFRMLAVQDTETRLTESIEEGQDTGAVRRVRERAEALGATTVTILAGSPRLDPAALAYPGQRSVCSVRTAGPAGSPVTRITTQGDYVKLILLTPGEVLTECAPDFVGGTPTRPATNVPFSYTVAAVDRYGHIVPVADSVRIELVSGPPAVIGPPVKFADGDGVIPVTYQGYGISTMSLVGKRVRGTEAYLIAGVTRIWTGASSADWHTGSNWQMGGVPMSLDSIQIPAAAANFPVIAAPVTVQDLTVENGATLTLNSLDLTAQGDVVAGLTGGILSTTGRLRLTGAAQTVRGKISLLQLTGTYSLAEHVTARAPLEVAGGELASSGYEVRVESN